jgi:hypothetical protein
LQEKAANPQGLAAFLLAFLFLATHTATSGKEAHPMTFRFAASAAATISVAIATTCLAPPAHAQTPPDSQWRATSTTLSTLLQDGFKIVAVVNDNGGNAGPADTIFVQRDQSAFKCIDPQTDLKAKTRTAPPACFELVPPSGPVPGPDAK